MRPARWEPHDMRHGHPPALLSRSFISRNIANYCKIIIFKYFANFKCYIIIAKYRENITFRDWAASALFSVPMFTVTIGEIGTNIGCQSHYVPRSWCCGDYLKIIRRGRRLSQDNPAGRRLSRDIRPGGDYFEIIRPAFIWR